MKRYFAADNYYGSDTSIGFANTWFVMAFDGKKARDEWVENAPNLSAMAIRKDEVTYYLTLGGERDIAPFTQDCWCIFNVLEYTGNEIPGYLGHVMSRKQMDWQEADRLYRRSK